jgi:hypothetical protein
MAQVSNLEDRDKTTFFVVGASFALAISLWIKLHHWLYNAVDEVYDGGDFLLLRSHGKEETVLLSNIASVTWIDNRAWTGWGIQTEPRVTIQLFRSSKFGQTIVFFTRERDTEVIAKSLRAKQIEARLSANDGQV